MSAVRALLRTSLISALIGLLLLGGGLTGFRPDLNWFAAHGLILTLGGVMPALAAGHAFTLQQLANTKFDEGRVAIAANLWLIGALLVGAGAWLPYDAVLYAGVLATVALIGGATIWCVQVMKNAPKSGLTDVERDPLTKGDDACLKHVHFAHRFLPIGLLLLLVGMAMTGAWGHRITVAATHVIVIGYGLLSMYGISHFWVPRLSGIPAIAAGAIKGELHTSLLGIVGVTVGFIIGVDTSVGRGFLVALGPMVFLGFFVWMGVLGANIMKNKSPTNSVRPEFVYIPWVFSAVFWAVTAVLMGIFLPALPESMSHLAPALRFTHLHAGLLGGAVQLLVGLSVRQIPDLMGRQPPRFGAAMKGSFYAFNVGLALAMYGRFAGATGLWVSIGLLLMAVSVILYLRAMTPRN